MHETLTWASTANKIMAVKMTFARVVETSIIINNNSSFQNYNADLLYRQKEKQNKIKVTLKKNNK